MAGAQSVVRVIVDGRAVGLNPPAVILGARVIVYPTVREADGLALSSRNVFLTPGQRRAAPVLFQALKAGRAAIRTGGRSGAQIQQAMRKVLSAESTLRMAC